MANLLSAEFVQVLEYLDGPQAVLLRRSADLRIVAVAIDETKNRHNFFGAEISGEQWERYRRGFVDLRFLFMYPKRRRWYFFALDASTNKKDVSLFPTDKNAQIEEDYIPEAGFFAYDHSEAIADFTSKSMSTQKYRTDGIWDLPDFSSFYNKITDLYAFFLSLRKYADDNVSIDLKRKIRTSFAEQPLRGGSSYVNLYSGLLSVQSLGDRLSVGKLKYASPGEVDVRGRLDIFQEIAVSLAEFEVNYYALKKQYDELYSYLAINKLLKRDPEHFDNEGTASKYIYRRSNDLFKNMKVDETTLIYDLTGKNALLYTKVSLVHFRRIERYFMFFAEGRVKDPETVPGFNR